jgi:16S rRNA (guanine527-N7)-methyltransferase
MGRWNRVLNLTRIRDLDEIVERHYCESLFLGMQLPSHSIKIVDVGSGAGLPGIPVAILRPDCSVTLVEAHQRKSVFLREAIRHLANARVLASRIEQVSEIFDWAISRAVRCREIERSLNNIAPNVALLGGQDSPIGRFTWNKIKVPWGKQRFLWIGSST